MTQFVQPKAQVFSRLNEHMNQRILGQTDLVKKLIIALLADGHLLVEGAPGLAKTRAIKELATQIDGSFHRIQFTPDLLPGDLTGTDIFRPENSTFEFQKGPIFHNVVLADEINRAPAKVQAALLEAMEERQITVGRKSYILPELFLVMATQNPIEQEGTYPLPEAQLDRFLMYVKVDYPDAKIENNILQLARNESAGTNIISKTASLHEKDIISARKEINQIHLSPALESYIVQLVIATRNPNAFDPKLDNWLRYGASPRATIALDRCSRAHAWLMGKDYVSPEDIHSVIYDILRHRILLSFEAEAEGVTTDDFISELLKVVAIP
ncbi:MAG: MoxR family ATPase [Legionellales bacterium]|nr:MoxR family ATPase [Legionellales bacterium]